MFRKIIQRLATGLFLTLFAAVAAQATTIRIAQNDGTQGFGGSLYVSGFGSAGAANYISNTLALYNDRTDNLMILVTMGDFVDYFRPTTGTTLLEMLTSSNRHLWSATANGTFVAPVYSSSSRAFGGSAAGWPATFVPGDDRDTLSFWGVNSRVTGGCCLSTAGGAEGWGQAFTMDLILPVPLPAGLPLLVGGFGLLTLLGWRRRATANA